MTPRDSYENVMEAACRVSWRIEDVIDGTARLDAGRPFMPASLQRLDWADGRAVERLWLNQICGHTYLHLFGLFEEFILPFVYDQIPDEAVDDIAKARALLGFAAEEAKHIDLFKRFRARFRDDIAIPCDGAGRASQVATAVLGHSPIGVCLAVLHLEWMTQRHYLECVQQETRVDPLFRSLLRHHWVEEAQHARLDALMLDSLARHADARAIACGIEDYVAILHRLDGVLRAQAALDVVALERRARADGRPLLAPGLAARHHRSLRWMFLGSGMTHPRLLKAIEGLRPMAADRVASLAAIYS